MTYPSVATPLQKGPYRKDIRGEGGMGIDIITPPLVGTKNRGKCQFLVPTKGGVIISMCLVIAYHEAKYITYITLHKSYQIELQISLVILCSTSGLAA